MDSIYDILLSMPIFKGVTGEQLTHFVEKTPLGFARYSSGDKIVSSGDICDRMLCIVRGSVRVVRYAMQGKVRIVQSLDTSAMIGLENLFGLDTFYDFDAFAEGDDCGVMEFSKAEFIRLVSENNIPLINYLNYLSAAARRPRFITDAIYSDNLSRNLLSLVLCAVGPQSDSIIIETFNSDLLSILGNDEESDMAFERLQGDGLITRQSAWRLVIPFRRKLIRALTSSI